MIEVGLKGFIEYDQTAFGLILCPFTFAVHLQVLVKGLLEYGTSVGELEVPVVFNCVVTSSQQ